MTTAVEAPPVRFHLSLNVSSIPKAVELLEGLLGTPPAKLRPDYAKFELDSPPLVLSLEARAPGQHGSLNHLGFRFADSAALVDAQIRLEKAGISTQREEGVECCYARQTKFWVHDLDHRLWEFYTLDDDLDHRGMGQSLEEMVGPDTAAALVTLHQLGQFPTQESPADQPVIWAHMMFEPFIVPTTPCDEIRLRGTWNVPVTGDELAAQLAQVFAALKPGGTMMAHILTAESPVEGKLQLPGPAAYVSHVPVRQQLAAALEAAGFVDQQLTTFRSGACFQHQGQPLRETQIVARRPMPASSETCTVVFKGPFQTVTDDEGHTWRRGEPTTIPTSRWSSLQESAVGELFVLLPESAPVSHCGV